VALGTIADPPITPTLKVGEKLQVPFDAVQLYDVVVLGLAVIELVPCPDAIEPPVQL